jgi:hypothetical protein
MTCSYAEFAGPLSLAVAVGVVVGLAAARSWRKVPEVRIGDGMPAVAPPPLGKKLDGPELGRIANWNQGQGTEDRR